MHRLINTHGSAHIHTTTTTHSLAWTPEKALAYLSPQIVKWIKSHIWHVQGTGQITRKTLSLTAITAQHDLCVFLCVCVEEAEKASGCVLACVCFPMWRHRTDNCASVCLCAPGHVCLEEWCSGWPRTQSIKTHTFIFQTHTACPDKEMCVRGRSACVWCQLETEKGSPSYPTNVCVGLSSDTKRSLIDSPGYRCPLWRWQRGEIPLKTREITSFALLLFTHSHPQ